jgi:LysM repeat protein
MVAQMNHPTYNKRALQRPSQQLQPLSLFAIAQKFNLSAPALVELNRIKNPDRVSAGTELLLPPSNGFVPIGATTTMPP